MEPKPELQKSAVAEARTRDLETYQRALDAQWLDNRMEDGRVGRCLASIHKAAEMEKDSKEVQEQHAVLNDKDALQLEEAEKKEKRGQYRRELQQQLADKQQQIQGQYEDTRIDKKRMDDIMRTISDEDKRELQDKRDHMEKIHREMVTFQQTREDLRSKQKQQLVSDERRAKEQRAVGDDRSAAMRTERKQEQRDISAVNQKVVKQHIADEATRHERDITTREHQDQEYREKNVQFDIAENKTFEKLKSDTNQAYNTQMDYKKRMGEEQKTRDVEYRKKTDAILAMGDEIDIDNEYQKKAENHVYSLELLNQIDDNRRRRQNEKQADDELGGSFWEWNKSWSKDVTEDRKKRAGKKIGTAGANRHED